MKNKNLITWLAFSFTAMLLLFIVVVNLNRPRIFIVHSYALDFSWDRGINEGLERILGSKPYYLRWHYMDTKRHPDADFKNKAGATARKMIIDWKPDVLIAIDDNAQEFVAKYFVNDPFIKIVFTGVNAEPGQYQYNSATNVTGILERIPFEAFKEVFLQILPPEKRRVYHVSDNSNTSELIFREMEHFDWSPLTLVKSERVNTFDQWKNAIREAEARSDILLVTHYHTIKEKLSDKTVVPPKSIIDWTEAHTKMFGIGCWGFYVEDGGHIAVGLSPYEQGEEAAKLAVKIIENRYNLKNKKLQDYLPIAKSRQYLLYMRRKGLDDRGVKIPKILEAFARATNHYFEK